jgi:hypothetical protein
MNLQEILTALPKLNKADICDIMRTGIALIAKGEKAGVVKEKKVGSMPKGVVPKQLMKPRAWVDFTLKHAQENGWEAYNVTQTKKDKVTGEKKETIVEMPGSIEHNGVHVFEGTVTEKTPEGRTMIHKDAMSLSKQRWTPKTQTGTHPELYAEFEESYVEDASEAVVEEASEEVVEEVAEKVVEPVKKAVKKVSKK